MGKSDQKKETNLHGRKSQSDQIGRKRKAAERRKSLPRLSKLGRTGWMDELWSVGYTNTAQMVKDGRKEKRKGQKKKTKILRKLKEKKRTIEPLSQSDTFSRPD